MAWGGAEKSKALKQVGKLIADGMGAREAIRVVAKGTGVPVRTIESWYWPNKRTKEDASPSKAALTQKYTECGFVGTEAVLNRLVKVAAASDSNLTVCPPCPSSYRVGVGAYVEMARGRGGYSDEATLAGLALSLFDEADRLKKLNTELELKLATQL